MAYEEPLQVLSERIEQRERKAATYRAFVMLHVETRRSAAPTSQMKAQPLTFDTSEG